MIQIEDPLTAFLGADQGVSAIVGSRIYPVQAAHGAEAPYIAYQLISMMRVASFQGLTGLAHARVQLGCWGNSETSYTDARALTLAVRQATGGSVGVPADQSAGSRTAKLDGFRGYWGSVFIGRCKVDNEHDAHGAGLGGASGAAAVTAGGKVRPLLGVLVDLLIWFDEGT